MKGGSFLKGARGQLAVGLLIHSIYQVKGSKTQRKKRGGGGDRIFPSFLLARAGIWSPQEGPRGTKDPPG